MLHRLCLVWQLHCILMGTYQWQESEAFLVTMCEVILVFWWTYMIAVRYPYDLCLPELIVMLKALLCSCLLLTELLSLHIGIWRYSQCMWSCCHIILKIRIGKYSSILDNQLHMWSAMMLYNFGNKIGSSICWQMSLQWRDLMKYYQVIFICIVQSYKPYKVTGNSYMEQFC